MLADCSNRSPTGSLSFFSWNINGIFAKPLGDKLQNNECLNLICQFDFVILSETWKETIIDVTGYRLVVSGTALDGSAAKSHSRTTQYRQLRRLGTFSLKCLKILKTTLNLFTLKDRFFSWVTLILEQENIRIV